MPLVDLGGASQRIAAEPAPVADHSGTGMELADLV
jgi:hypothetical protein